MYISHANDPSQAFTMYRLFRNYYTCQGSILFPPTSISLGHLKLPCWPSQMSSEPLMGFEQFSAVHSYVSHARSIDPLVEFEPVGNALMIRVFLKTNPNLKAQSIVIWLSIDLCLHKTPQFICLHWSLFLSMEKILLKAGLFSPVQPNFRNYPKMWHILGFSSQV